MMAENKKESDGGVYVPGALLRCTDLTPLKSLFLAKIAYLEGRKDKCVAANSTFGRWFGMSKIRASQTICSLQECGYVSVEITKNPGKRQSRRIRLTVKSAKLFGKDYLEKLNISENDISRKSTRGISKNLSKLSRKTIPKVIYKEDNKKHNPQTPKGAVFSFEDFRRCYPKQDEHGHTFSLNEWQAAQDRWSEIVSPVPGLAEYIQHRTETAKRSHIKSPAAYLQELKTAFAKRKRKGAA